MLSQSLLGLIAAFAFLVSSSAQEPALTPEAARAAEKMKAAFSEKSPVTRGFRTRGAAITTTRSGNVIRQRGPVPTLVPPQIAAAADAQDSLTPTRTDYSKPPPDIPNKLVDHVTTGESEARVDPQQKIAFDSILFDLDSATVGPESREILRGIARALKTMPDRRFLVEGHTCDLGDDNGPEHNIRLSCLRAEAVCAWLIHFGASPTQVQPMGFGSKDPIEKPNPFLSKTANEAYRAQNRRAAFRRLVR